MSDGILIYDRKHTPDRSVWRVFFAIQRLKMKINSRMRKPPPRSRWGLVRLYRWNIYLAVKIYEEERHGNKDNSYVEEKAIAVGTSVLFTHLVIVICYVLRRFTMHGDEHISKP